MMGLCVLISVFKFFVAYMARAPLHHLHCVVVKHFEIIAFLSVVV